jgi:hypothetical protein
LVVHDFWLVVHGRFWLVVPDFVGCSWPAERDGEGERKHINKKSVNR